MIAKHSGGGDFEQAPPGTHVAICYKLIDLGTTEQEYQGKTSRKRQIIVGWELPNELMTTGEYAGKPFTTSKFYTLSLSEKANLRAALKNWRGRDFTPEELSGFELKNLLGKPCMLSLTENEKGKVCVSGVMALPRGTSVPPQASPDVYFSFDEFDESVFESFSERMRDMIGKADEFARAAGKSVPSNGPKGMTDDDIPF